MGKNNLNKKLYEMSLGRGRTNLLDTSSYRMIGNSTYGLASNSYEMSDPFKATNYRSDYEIARERAAAEIEARIARFATNGRAMSHSAMVKYIPSHDDDDDVQRPLKLTGVRFSEPVTGLIASRPGVYGVASVHHIAGYKIVIKRFEDTTDDVVWYETPIRSYHCKFDKLEEIIHEHLLEAIQRDLEWNRIK